MEPFSFVKWIRTAFAPRPVRTIRQDSRPLTVEALEGRVLPAGQLVYNAPDATPITPRVVNDTVVVESSAAPGTVLTSGRLADVNTVRGNGFGVALTLDASVPRFATGVAFQGGTGNTTLAGPARDATGNVTGAGAGNIGDPGFVRFTGVRNLTGAANTSDTFVLDGGTVRYSGMEPVRFTQAAGTFTVFGTAGNDAITLRALSGVPGAALEVGGTGGTVQLANPAEALVIKGLKGRDAITVASVSPDFAASLRVYGNDSGAPTLVSDVDTDTVTFAGDVNTRGNYLEAFAESITVNPGVQLRTSDPSVVFDPATAVDLTAGTIDVGPGEPFEDGGTVRYAHVRGRGLFRSDGGRSRSFRTVRRTPSPGCPARAPSNCCTRTGTRCPWPRSRPGPSTP